MSMQRAAMAVCWLLCVLLAVVAAVFVSHATTTTPPVLQLDLRAWGAVGLQGPSDESLKPTPEQSLTFLDNSTLAVSFPVFNSGAKLGTRDRPGGGSIVFHTTLVDVHTGQVKGERNWGSVYLPHTMEGISGERLLVRVADELAIYSRDWKLERQYRLKSPSDPKRIGVSPSGQTVYVITRQGPDQEHMDLLAAPDFKEWSGFGVQWADWRSPTPDSPLRSEKIRSLICTCSP